jgi:iron(III) transport system ATP-binding protein
MTAVRLEKIAKHFGKTIALSNIDLEINAGELFFLLGPSGCGKSTLLRLIAGLHEPSSGRILFDGQNVTKQDTRKRNAVMVFQSYALWPHMTVRENVRFGLDVRRMPRRDQDLRIAEVLKLVQLEELAERKPNELSGGQQQRVALARALAVKPDCLLLDEPLSNLDARLRDEMRREIRRICKDAGCTTIYVTHDQKEALSIADRIAIMDHGKIAQVGTAAELYHKPVSRFVAEFIGQTNVLPARVIEQERGLVRMQTGIGYVMAFSEVRLPESVTLLIRPEQMRVVSSDGFRVITDESEGTRSAGRNRFIGEVKESIFLGESSEHVVEVNEQCVRVMCTPPMWDVPEEVLIEFDPERVVILKNDSLA